MNILNVLSKTMTTGTVVRDLLIEHKPQDLLVFLSTEDITILDITTSLKAREFNPEEVELLGPTKTTFGNPLQLPCDLSLANEFFKTYFTEHNLKNSPNLHLVIDAPINVYVWKLAQHNNVAALQRDLDKRVQALIPSAPLGRRWQVLTNTLKQADPMQKPEYTLITGIPDDHATTLFNWAREFQAYPMSVYPISLIGLREAMQTQHSTLQVYMYVGNDSKFSVITHKTKGIIFSETIESARACDQELIDEQLENAREIAADLGDIDVSNSVKVFSMVEADIQSLQNVDPVFTINGKPTHTDIAKNYINNYYI